MSGTEIKCNKCGNILLSINQLIKRKEYNLFGWTFYKDQNTTLSFGMLGKCILKCTCGVEELLHNGTIVNLYNADTQEWDKELPTKMTPIPPKTRTKKDIKY